MSAAAVGKSEQDLLLKLEEWLETQPDSPTIFDVCDTHDGELMAVFIRKGAREAARDAVLGRMAHEAAAIFNPDEAGLVAPLFRVWDGLSRAWSLNTTEQAALLGLEGPEHLGELRAAALLSVPTQVIERIAILLDIFKALNILLPLPDAADGWIRKPNRAPLFAGQPALQLMLNKGLPGLREVRAYLQSNLH